MCVPSEHPPESKPAPTPLALNHTEAQRTLGVSRETLDKLIGAGYLPGAKKIGTGRNGRWIIPVRSIERFLMRDFPCNCVPLRIGIR